MPGDRPWDDLPALFEMIEELRADGKSEDEIKSFLDALEHEQWVKADAELAAAGASEEERAEFWAALNSFGDGDADDMVDEGDEGYTPEGEAVE